MSDSHKHCTCGCYNAAIDLILKKSNAGKNLYSIQENTAEDRKAQPHVFYNAKIYPVEIYNKEGKKEIRPDVTYTAMGIAEGRVVCLGNDKQEVLDQMKEYSFHEENVLDVKGKTILPGLVEPHCHIVPSATVFATKLNGKKLWCDYTPFEGQYLRLDYTKADLKKRLNSDLKSMNQPEYWLLGNGIDPSLMKDCLATNCREKNIVDSIDNEFLDSLNNPNQHAIFLLSASGHTAYVNTKALELTWKHNEQALRELHFTSYQDYLDQTKGVLQEFYLITPTIAVFNQEQLQAIGDTLSSGIRSFFDDAKSKGVTFMYDAGMTADWAKNYFSTAPPAHKNMHVGMAYLYAMDKSREEAIKELNEFMKEEFTPPQKAEDLFAYWGSVKIVSDGSNQGLTGYQTQAYVCPPSNNFGVYNFAEQIGDENLYPEKPAQYENSLVKNVVAHKWPAMIHANGTQAIENTIQAYEHAFSALEMDEESFKEMRYRIEHCSLLNENKLNRMKKLGICPSFLIGHVGYWGDVFNSYIFPDNEAYTSLDLCHSARKDTDQYKGLRLSLHSDCMVSPVGVLRCMEQAYTRIMEAGSKAKEYQLDHLEGNAKPELVSQLPVLNQYEQLSRQNILRANTIDAAWQCHADELVGSLLPQKKEGDQLVKGKLADFIILEENPMEMNRNQAYLNMRNITINQVWIEGVQQELPDESKKEQNTLAEKLMETYSAS